MLAVVGLGALFLGIPHIQESAEAALAPKKQPPQDGPAGQDPGWLESPPHPPSPPPDPPSRPKGCDMQGVYCKNETKANDHGDGNGGEELKADEDHSEGGALKKLAKKVKAKSKMARAHKKIASAGANKKKLKKKLKAHEKLAAAKARQHAAAARKGDDDGAVSFLQYEAATRDAAALQPHRLSLLLKKLASSSSDGEDEGEDEEGEDEEDWCNPTVQEAAFKEVDAGGDGASGDGEVDAQEMTDFAEGEGVSAEEAAGVFAMMDTNGDGKVTLDEWKAAINMFEKCDEEAAHTTNLKAHTQGGGKKKLKKKLKAMEKKAEARRKQESNAHAKKMIKKKIKAAEKIAEAKERKDAAAARKPAEQDGDDGKDVKAR